MTLKKTLLSVFALAATLVSCSSDDTEQDAPAGPATVEALTSPRDGLSANIYLLEAIRFEWEAAAEDATYTLVFDKAEGNFSSPVATFETTENSRTFTKEEVLTLFEENADEKGEVADLAWAVYTTTPEGGRRLSKETRRITFTTLSTPAVVETLIAPKDETVLIFKDLKGDVTFSWSKALWLGDELAVSYTFVLDEAGKDFSNPLLSVELKADGEKPAATKTVVTKAKLEEFYAASAAAAEEDYYNLQWAVYTKVEKNNTLSEEIRTLSVIPKKKVGEFADGDPLYIGVPASGEDGQIATYVKDDYYVTNTPDNSYHDRADDFNEKIEFPYYEIFAQLKAGEKYYFYTLGEDNDKTHFFKATAADGFAEADDQNGAAVEAPEEGIYRIRIKVGQTSKVHMRKVEYIHLRFGWGDYNQNKFTDTPMTYKGKGVWTIPTYNIALKDMGSYKEDRYRFVLKFADWSNPQGLAQNVTSTGDRPQEGQDKSYWDVQLSYMGWDTRVFKFPAWLCDDANPNKWCADVNLYLNAEKGHYTHEFVNPTEVKPFEDGAALFIDGEGSEAGQKMSYITADSYNPNLASAGEIDAFKDQDYKYEIFTRLKGGAKFYFRSATGTDLFSLNAAGDAVEKIASEADAKGTVAEDGIYRIRFNVESGKAYIAPIGEVYEILSWTSKKTKMTYAGKGVWKIANFQIELVPTDYGFDERYKFIMMIDGKEQPYGRMSNNGNRPNKDTGADYWYLQPAKPNQWEPLLKYPDELCDKNNLNRWYADLYLYMNDDKGHYTHEFTNYHE